MRCDLSYGRNSSCECSQTDLTAKQAKASRAAAVSHRPNMQRGLRPEKADGAWCSVR